MTKPAVRLHLYLAAGSDRAVILRQGPARQARMILWHRDTDSFEDGQWLKQRLYKDRCAISPDGRHFLFFALNGHWGGVAQGAYTAISRPPYFTAVALFPQGNTWGGGGWFVDNSLFVADGAADVIGGAKDLVRLVRTDVSPRYPLGLKLADGRAAPIGKAKAARAFKAPEPVPELELYETSGGRLYRREGADLTLIRDFTEMAFEPIRAPYDTRPQNDADPDSAPSWHPLGRGKG
ncbi:MAG: hypothetical protein AAF667_08200 [Pseudomonadota bacterium]